MGGSSPGIRISRLTTRLSDARATSCWRHVCSATESKKLTLCLERSANDAQLWDTGVFSYGVHPDLPFATTWGAALQYFQRYIAARGALSPPKPTVPLPPHKNRVQSIAAQLRSIQELRELMVAACRGVPPQAAKGPPLEELVPANTLLFVSGCHPVRSLPLASWVLSNSRDLLMEAVALRSQGLIPTDTKLWAVSNPVSTTEAALARRKVDVGAEAIVTQPPFAWGAFEEWSNELERTGVTKDVGVIVGLPIITSVLNLEFWLELCSMGSHPEARQLVASVVRQLEGAGTDDRAAQEEFWLGWNEQFVEKVASLPWVAGLHVMPVTAKGRQLAVRMVREGILPPA